MSLTPTEVAIAWGDPDARWPDSPPAKRERCELEPAYSMHGPVFAVVTGAKRPLRVCETCATSRLFQWASVDPLARCPVCDGVREHVLGCPEQDAPR